MTRHRHLITEANARWWTLGAMCFALFMIMLDNTVVNVALPSIQRELGSSISGLEWTLNGYTLAFAVMLATGGRLGDIFGRRRAFLFGVILFAASSATAGLAQNTAELVASRVIQGIGAGFMMPATLSIVTNAFDPSERGKAIGTWAGVSALALAVGPVLGGFLTEHVSWRAIFYINIPVAVAAVTATLFAVRESRDETVGREPGGGGREGEERHADQEHQAATEDVAKAATGCQEHREGKRVAVHRPLEAREAGAEVALDRGERDVDDGVVHHQHEQREAHRPERPPLAVLVGDQVAIPGDFKSSFSSR